MFINRDEELRSLEESYRFFLEGHSRGVLIYGFRKVGKTRLVEEFLKGKAGIIIDLSVARSIKALCKVFVNRLGALANIEFSCADADLDSLVKFFLLPQKVAEKLGNKIIVALDEFHVPIEKISSNMSRALGEKKEQIIGDILWNMRYAITNSKDVFWILISSIGWKKIQEYIARKYGGPLVGVLDSLRVDPLDYESSRELAMALTNNSNIADEIARVSGGIPRIIEILSRRYNSTHERIVRLAINSIVEGEFDEIFDNMICSLADISRRDYGILQLTLKCVAEGAKTTESVSECLESSRDVAYACLEELHTLGLLEKKKKGKFVEYHLHYPLLGEWLKLRVEPRISKRLVSMSMFGITAESYVRELLMELEGKRIEIWEDKEGRYFAGTTNRLVLEIEKVLTKKETEKILKSTKNADIIAYGKEVIYVIEVKAKTKPITSEDIEQLVKTSKKLSKNTKPILISLVETKINPTAIAQAIKNDTIIITSEGIKIIAKKVDFPHW